MFELRFTATAEDIDQLGHVNNAVWVRWMEQISTGHWFAHAEPADIEKFFWVVVRHEVDYLGNVGPGETAVGRTWVGDAPRGARFERHIEFTGPDGRLKVRARSTWAIIDKQRGRPVRVPKWIAERFGAGT